MTPLPFAGTGLLLDDVHYGVGGRAVLAGVSAHLVERRIGILGRNGSGKTTLLRLMAGLIRPAGGRVRVDGLDPAADRKAMLPRVGILFQNPDHQILFPTVEEEIAFGLRGGGLDTGAALAAARQVLAGHGRGHWAGAAVHVLSQGQRQYLCLMAVLAMGPATLLLDEPFAGLDLPTVMRLTRAFADLPQRLITVTHDPGTVAGHDRVLWLEAGRIRQDGPAEVVAAAYAAEMARIGDADADTDLAH